MTPLLIVAAIVAAPVVFWFVRRRAKLRANDNAVAGPPANHPVVLPVAATLEEPLSTDELRVGATEAPGDSGDENSSAPRPAFAKEAQSQSEPDRSILLDDFQPCAEDALIDASLADEQDGPIEQPWHDHSEGSLSQPVPEAPPEHEVLADQMETAGVFDQAVPDAEVSLTVPAPSGDLQAECTAPETTTVLTGSNEEFPAEPGAALLEPPQKPDDGTNADMPSGSIGQETTFDAEEALPAPASGKELQAQDTSPEAQIDLTVIEELPSGVDDAQSELPPEPAAPTDPATGKAPHRYRPPPQRVPRQRPAKAPPAPRERANSSDLSFEIRVRMMFDRFDFCEIRFLPVRTPELDSEIEARSVGDPVRLLGQEEWYEDLLLDNIGDRLRNGLELTAVLADQRRARWLLTGRDVYVLASHQRATGVVSTSRLALGRSHVVLCTAGFLPQVERILGEAGCQGYTKLGEADGIPAGWVGLRGVAPTKAVPLFPGIDPFYPIKPSPDIEIELEGGVCLHHSVWLAGFPPRIKLLGQIDSPVRVLIDGKEASSTAEGFLTADGYDAPGAHSVFCEGLSCSRTYSIEEPPDAWAEWPAHSFGQAGFCGPQVHLPPEAAHRRIFSVPMSNPLLLGAEPGQIFRCSSRSVSSWKGFVPFDVVWALPDQPLICDKKTSRILQFADVPLALAQAPKRPVLRWCAAILDASRKGLKIHNSSPDGTVRWKEYKKAARNFWRAAR